MSIQTSDIQLTSTTKLQTLILRPRKWRTWSFGFACLVGIETVLQTSL